MSSVQDFKQSPHKLLVIPGPIEVSDEVLLANAHPSMSHVSLEFVPVFGDCIRMIREVLYTKNAQPFLIAGSGTLGWDQVAANLVEPGENVLVLHSGYFGDSFEECLQTYGAKVDQIEAEIGAAVSQIEIEKALKSKKYKVLTFTHVDTSTGTYLVVDLSVDNGNMITFFEPSYQMRKQSQRLLEKFHLKLWSSWMEYVPWQAKRSRWMNGEST